MSSEPSSACHFVSAWLEGKRRDDKFDQRLVELIALYPSEGKVAEGELVKAVIALADQAGESDAGC